MNFNGKICMILYNRHLTKVYHKDENLNSISHLNLGNRN